MSGIPPNYITGEQYELRFSAPDATSSTAQARYGVLAAFTNGLQKISDIIVQFAQQPAGSGPADRAERCGLQLCDARSGRGRHVAPAERGHGTTLPAACFDDPAQQNQVTLASGYYRFDLNFTDPACPSGGNYLIDVSPPPTGYIGTYSQIIPPTSGSSTAAVLRARVPGRRGRRAGRRPPTYCEVQTSEFAPHAGARRTQRRHALPRALEARQQPDPGLEPDLQQPHPGGSGPAAACCRSPRRRRSLNVVRGQLVPYIITYKNVTDVPLFDVSIVDRYPGGLPLRRGLGAHRRQAGRAGGGRPRARSGATSRSTARGRTRCW